MSLASRFLSMVVGSNTYCKSGAAHADARPLLIGCALTGADPVQFDIKP